MKKLSLMLAVSLAAPVFAAVPLRWTVDTSRVIPAVFEVVRGETIELEAAFNSYGKPLEMSGKDVSIFWQTNGMGSAWWSAPATAASNTVAAAFTPAMDPGAATVSGFLGVPGEIYRAAFVLRFRHGPGAVPNELELPRKTIDFATVEVKNAPWASKDDVLAAQAAADDAKATADDAKSAADDAQTKATEVLQILDGDDFRITVTNYDSQINLPMTYFEARYTDGTNKVWRQVWNETNRLEVAKRETLAAASNTFATVDEEVAGRAWGNFDSATGDAAPEGFAQCSNSGGMIFGNGAGFKSYVTASGNSYWIWQQNSGLARVETNGVFRILDADGKTAFSVTKGEKQIIGADASGIKVADSDAGKVITITYTVDAAAAPKLEYADSLDYGGAWSAEGDDTMPGGISIGWEKHGGSWVCTVTDADSSLQGFFRATYEKGAESIVTVGSTPMAMEYIYLGGKKYQLGTATIDGKMVLTLTEK